MITRAYVTTPEGQVHYQRAGQGDRTILLLHQSPVSSDQYLKVMPLLAARYTVLAPDNLGYGKTDKPSGLIEVADYARNACHFLKALNIGRASVVGHHTGASIGVELAIAHPEMVDRLILYGCPTIDPVVREKLLSHPRYAPLDIKEDGSHLLRVWQFFQRGSPEAGPEIWHQLVSQCLPAGKDPFAGEKTVFRYREEPRLPLVKTPTLLISGTKDVFHARLDVLERLMPDAAVTIIEGGDSQVLLRMPEEFTRAVLDFLE
ncbi:MAG: alpha/beta hydrolase [Chloroflexi bacterium]|nr:alpha/beta hydrolase [Chloroflexota bacterium]